jgi:uncharacterized membrane protein YfhO
VLFLSIPFNRGWRATVDGQAATVHLINAGFIGIPLPAGDHALELRFSPEGGRLGLTVSLLAALGGLAWVALGARRRISGEPGAAADTRT